MTSIPCEDALLDQLRISQTSERQRARETYPSASVFCTRGAPFFALQTSEKGYAVQQGSCDSWTCPRCGQLRAKHEYGRIVEGARSLAAKHPLMFFTITCKGREIALEDAEKGYLSWTNRLLTALRTKAQRSAKFWAYAQVTERQQRGHPHSHILMTFKPDDLAEGSVQKWSTVKGKPIMKEVAALRSEYLAERVVSAGLGSQYDISEVQSAEAASRYVAKYMFKPSMFKTDWPNHWRRVRYSQSWPKLEAYQGSAFVLLKSEDWQRLARLAVVVTPKDEQSLLECQYRLRGADVLLRSLAV